MINFALESRYGPVHPRFNGGNAAKRRLVAKWLTEAPIEAGGTPCVDRRRLEEEGPPPLTDGPYGGWAPELMLEPVDDQPPFGGFLADAPHDQPPPSQPTPADQQPDHVLAAAFAAAADDDQDDD